MHRIGLIVLVCLFATVMPAWAQAPALGNCKVSFQQSTRVEGINQNHYKLHGQVSARCDDVQLFADEAEVFVDTNRLLAWGNVVFVSQTSRIAAERMDYNTRTRTGTFYVASGTATMETKPAQRSLFGTQEPDAYFWGQTIEKLAPQTYKITHGGFTTCVQPTPRWEIVTSSAIITLHEHAVLHNAILKVKGVPLFYLPAFYYPIQDDDRATGFLIPTYGSSTIRGQSISNAFFWAIDRSQDATVYHDWFSKTGQGVGGEYRYIFGPGSQGNLKTYMLREHDTVYAQPDGSEVPYAGQQSYQITGSMSQPLPDHLRVSGNVNYFSSLVAQQRYQQDIYAATNRTRQYGANLLGNWSLFTLSGTFNRSEVFYGDTSSTVVGSTPQITITRPERPIGKLPIYVGATTTYVTLVRDDKVKTRETDHGLSRIDVEPTVRVPFTRWPFLTFNSSLSWRDTYWTESLGPKGVQVEDGIGRRYFDMSTQITGPVFTKIWNTPNRSYAQKFKHVIEPTLTLQHITPIDNFDQIVKLDGTDYVVGRVTRATYGVNNRFYAKKKTSRQILNVSISQTYYTDANAAQYDQQYQSSFNVTQPGAPPALLPPTHLSPVAIQVQASPTTRLDTTFRTEYDTQAHALRTLALNGSYSSGAWLTASAGWSERRFIPTLTGFNNPNSASNYVNAATTVKSPNNTFGGTYTFNYDFRRDLFLQQRWTVYYNSQCCGVAVEYQSFNYSGLVTTIGVPQDHRLNVSFTLAGIGSFSNLFGAFGGQRR